MLKSQGRLRLCDIWEIRERAGWYHSRMLSALLRLLGRSWAYLLLALSTSTLQTVLFSCILPVCIFIGNAVYQFGRMREQEVHLRQMLRDTLMPTVISVAFTLVIWALAFSWAVARTVYKEHSDLAARNRQLSEENVNLRMPPPALPAPPYHYRNELSVSETVDIIRKLRGTFQQQQPNIVFVLTAPEDNLGFKEDLNSMIVAACNLGGPMKGVDATIEPAPDPEVKVDSGIPPPRYPGIVIHAPDSMPRLLGTMLTYALGEVFITRKSETVPEGISRLNITPYQTLVWFEIGHGSPWRIAR